MENCIQREECKACKELYDAINDGQNRRLDALEVDAKQIHELAISVGKMAVCLEQMARELQKQGEKLAVIEAEPGNKWKQAVWIVIAGLIGAVLSWFISRLGMINSANLDFIILKSRLIGTALIYSVLKSKLIGVSLGYFILRILL